VHNSGELTYNPVPGTIAAWMNSCSDWGVDGAGKPRQGKNARSFAEKAGVLVKVIDEHDVAVCLASL
jgi:hypothetical protein